jgi:hypothetical protein
MTPPTIEEVLDSIVNNALDPSWFDDAPDANPFQVYRHENDVFIRVGYPAATFKISVEENATWPAFPA